MKLIIIALFTFLSCKSPEKATGYFYLPDKIDWAHPNSGIEEIDIRELSSFPVIYFKTDSIFYIISSTNELTQDSIAFGVETGFKIDKCIIQKKSDNEIIFNRNRIYSVLKMNSGIKERIEKLDSYKIDSFEYEGIYFSLDNRLNMKSKEKIIATINDFGE
jgi:hypothetical protein